MAPGMGTAGAAFWLPFITPPAFFCPFIAPVEHSGTRGLTRGAYFKAEVQAEPTRFHAGRGHPRSPRQVSAAAPSGSRGCRSGALRLPSSCRRRARRSGRRRSRPGWRQQWQQQPAAVAATGGGTPLCSCTAARVWRARWLLQGKAGACRSAGCRAGPLRSHTRRANMLGDAMVPCVDLHVCSFRARPC